MNEYLFIYLFFKEEKEASREMQRQQGRQKQRHQRRFLLTTSTATASSKDSVAPHQVNIKSHAEGLHSSVPLTQDIMSGFQQKIARRSKRQKS